MGKPRRFDSIRFLLLARYVLASCGLTVSFASDRYVRLSLLIESCVLAMNIVIWSLWKFQSGSIELISPTTCGGAAIKTSPLHRPKACLASVAFQYLRPIRV